MCNTLAKVITMYTAEAGKKLKFLAIQTCYDLPHSAWPSSKTIIGLVDLFIIISRVYFLPVAIALCVIIACLKLVYSSRYRKQTRLLAK